MEEVILLIVRIFATFTLIVAIAIGAVGANESVEQKRTAIRLGCAYYDENNNFMWRGEKKGPTQK